MNRIKLLASVAVAATAVLSTPLCAATITKSYQVTSTFGSGPFGTVVTSFDATFDPSLTTSADVAISNYATTGGLSFANPLGAYLYQAAISNPRYSSPESRIISVYGAANQQGTSGNTNDFMLNIYVAADGSVIRAAQTEYGIVGEKFLFIGSSVAREFSTTAVPEPAIWALMLAGFGLTGATLRRRQRPRVAFA